MEWPLISMFGGEVLTLLENPTAQRPVPPDAECLPMPPLGWTWRDGARLPRWEGPRPGSLSSSCEDELLPGAEGPVEVLDKASRKAQVETLVKGKCTLMISNIPCRISQEKLMEVVHSLGFEGTYDFLYVPTGGRSGRSRSVNLGYGFINFTRSSDCLRFALLFDGHRFEGTHGRNPCTVRPAETQGLFNNIRRLGRSLAPRPFHQHHISPIIWLAGGHQANFVDLAAALDYARHSWRHYDPERHSIPQTSALSGWQR